MKAEEIKVAFNTNIQLGLIDDIQKDIDAGGKYLDVSKTNATLAENSLKRAQINAREGVDKAKFLGVDTKPFQLKLDNATALMNMASKIKSV